MAEERSCWPGSPWDHASSTHSPEEGPWGRRPSGPGAHGCSSGSGSWRGSLGGGGEVPLEDDDLVAAPALGRVERGVRGLQQRLAGGAGRIGRVGGHPDADGGGEV